MQSLRPSSKNSTIVRSPAAIRLARVALQTAYLVSNAWGASLAERMFITPRRHVRPARERAILATGRPFDVEIELRSPRWNGQRVTVAAWRWGHGPQVLLVHGWEGRGAQLGAFVEPLVQAGFSVVTFDAPAHGDSPGRLLYLTDHADTLAGVIAAIGPVHATISHSFGAAALLLAGTRDGIDATRNVMLAPNVLIDEAVARFASAVGLLAQDRTRFEHQLSAHTGMPPDSLGIDALAGHRDTGLLIFHDRQDREVPFTHGDRLAATWPNAQLHEVSGLGHRRILRDSSVIADSVAFIGSDLELPASDLVREVDRYLHAFES